MEAEIEKTVARVLSGLSLDVVEMSIGRHRGDVKVNLVVHKEGGVSLDDLTAAQKTLRPRLELEFDREDLSLEIASPGTARKIKSDREYSIFTGRTVKVLVGDDWLRGTIINTDGRSVELDGDDGTIRIPFADIKKGKLD